MIRCDGGKWTFDEEEEEKCFSSVASLLGFDVRNAKSNTLNSYIFIDGALNKDWEVICYLGGIGYEVEYKNFHMYANDGIVIQHQFIRSGDPMGG